MLPTSRARKKLVRNKLRAARTRVATRLGDQLEKKWTEKFVKAGYRYVFVQVPVVGHIKRKHWRTGKVTIRNSPKIPIADIVFGNDLRDLMWFDSKLQHTTSFSSAQRVTYPHLNQNGGFILWQDAELPVNLVDNQPVSLDGLDLKPNGGHVGFEPDYTAVDAEQRRLTDMLDARRGNLHPPVSDLYLENSRMVSETRKKYRDVGSRGTGGGGGSTGAPKSGSRPLRRAVAQKLSSAATASRRAITKVSISAIRGVRWGSAFVYRMIIPPINPASLLFELIVFVAFELFSSYLEEKEKREFKKQLKRLPPLVAAAIKKNRAKAASMLVEDFEADGAGFIFAYIEAEVTKKVDLSPAMIAQGKSVQWDIRLWRLIWITTYRKPTSSQTEHVGRDEPLKSEEIARDPTLLIVNSLESKTATMLSFTIEEPIFTPFDYFLGALETLDQLLTKVREELSGIPGGVGAPPDTPKNFSTKDYNEAIVWIQKLTGLLRRHRSVEDVVGTDSARAIRKNMMWQGKAVMKKVSKSLHSMTQIGKLAPESDVFEAIGLVHYLSREFGRARLSRHKGYYYRREEKRPDSLKGRSYWRHIGWEWVN